MADAAGAVVAGVYDAVGSVAGGGVRGCYTQQKGGRSRLGFEPAGAGLEGIGNQGKQGHDHDGQEGQAVKGIQAQVYVRHGNILRV